MDREVHDCKTCVYGQALFRIEKDDRFTATYSPTGFVRCSGPRYRGRSFFRRDTCRGCGEYRQRARA